MYVIIMLKCVYMCTYIRTCIRTFLGVCTCCIFNLCVCNLDLYVRTYVGGVLVEQQDNVKLAIIILIIIIIIIIVSYFNWVAISLRLLLRPPVSHTLAHTHNQIKSIQIVWWLQ